jgi:gamma-glutamylcysteine synthetase
MKKNFKEKLNWKIHNVLYFMRSCWAVILYLFGKRPSCSTFIDETSITAGYGQLDDLGDFQYSFPLWLVRMRFKGCIKWDDYLKM